MDSIPYELLPRVAAFELPGGERIERTGAGTWAIRRDGQVMNDLGGFEHEPRPSSRDDAFFERTRASLADAFERARAAGLLNEPRERQLIRLEETLSDLAHLGDDENAAPLLAELGESTGVRCTARPGRTQAEHMRAEARRLIPIARGREADGQHLPSPVLEADWLALCETIRASAAR